jgi:hypothetical protein
MPITYDIKRFKRIEKTLERGKKRYLFIRAFYSALFYSVFMTLFNILIRDDKNNITKAILSFLFYFIFWYLLDFFFIAKSSWYDMEITYRDSKEYWEKQDPGILVNIEERKK